MPGQTVYCSNCAKPQTTQYVTPKETFVAHAAAWPANCSCGAQAWQNTKPLLSFNRAASNSNGQS